MPEETTKYVTESGAIYLQTINSENGIIKESWKREAKKPWNVKIDMAAYVSPEMREDLEFEYDLVKGDKDEKNKRKDLEHIIMKGKSENYKESGGSVISLVSNSKLAFSNLVIKIEKVK